jgi:hypothetical protein
MEVFYPFRDASLIRDPQCDSNTPPQGASSPAVASFMAVGQLVAP